MVFIEQLQEGGMRRFLHHFIAAALLAPAAVEAGTGTSSFSDFTTSPTSQATFAHADGGIYGGGVQTFAFGRNHYGQLFSAPDADSSFFTPNRFPFPPGLDQTSEVEVSSAGGHTLLLHPGATVQSGVYTVGCNQFGELGRSTNVGTKTPTFAPAKIQIPGNLVPSRAVAGGSFSVLIGPGTFMYTFGSNLYGQLGNAANAGTANPNSNLLFIAAPESVAVWDAGERGSAAGAEHFLIIGHMLDGSRALYAWGSNVYGQLGVPQNAGTNTPNPEPIRVPLPASPTAVYAGAHFSLVACADGNLYAFGRNRHGQLGSPANAGTDTPNFVPTAVPVPAEAVGWYNVAAGGQHVLAMGGADLEARLYAWGSNRYGQLGRATNSGTETPNPDPAPVAGLPVGDVNGSPRIVRAGADHSIAAYAVDPPTGYRKAWGSNLYGQLGHAQNFGTTNPNPSPLDISQTTTAIEEGAQPLPSEFSLGQNYPNPFNPSTTVSFTVARQSLAKVTLHDVLGRMVGIPFEGEVEPGVVHRVVIDASALPSGVYIYRLSADGFEASRKMTLLK
jgi:alpha-tubulin suppressor-like RCC1 family protein